MSDNESPTGDAGKSSRLVGATISAIAGLLIGAVALGVAELLAGLLGVRSPVIAVGDVVIDIVPAPVKDFAIATFGQNDKLALLVGIASFLVLLSVAVGFAARRSFLVAGAGVVVLCTAGVAAGVASPDPLFASIVPASIGAVAGLGALSAFRRVDGFVKARRTQAHTGAPMERRRFLLTAGGLTALAVIATSSGRWLTGRLSAAASRAAVILPAPLQRLAPIPAAANVDVPGVVPFVTPNPEFYRIDTALIVPQVRTEGWSLRVLGMVDRPFELTYDELLDMPMVERDITMTCVSNFVGGDLVSTSRFLGVPLRDMLDQAGVDPRRATQVVGRSVDGYTCGFPTSAAYDGRSCLVAVGMNGEPLPLEHGFPARLVTAGLYGYLSATKWLTEIEMATMEGFDSYWVRRDWAKEAPIKTQSRIDSIRPFDRLPAGSNAVGGVAWAQTRGIQRVEVRIDDDEWVDARLAAPVNDETWRQWAVEMDMTPGSHAITVRATDGTGTTQTPVRVEPIPDGASGWHQVPITVTA